jgi:hypothetical protein
MRGFCNVDVCWQYIADVSQQMVAESCMRRISLHTVRVEGKHFVAEGTSPIDEPGNVWLLAASAIELINGSPIFNGLGEESQTKTTPLPLLVNEDANDLNRLLVKCLNYDRKSRPVMNEIARVASEQVLARTKRQRPRRVVQTALDAVDVNETDRLWPEKLQKVRTVVMLLVLMLMSVIPLSAQSFLRNYDEPKMQNLLKAVMLLRNKTPENIDKSQDVLSKQIKDFTLMDELKDNKNDCIITGSNRFCVNVIVNELKRGRRVQASDKEMLSGENPHFQYSLYEKGVKKNATSTYTLSGRSGQQCFVIVPYSRKQNYSTELRIGSKAVSHPDRDENGITYYIISTKDGPKPGENITLKITNKDRDSDSSFVIINHNYRN